MVALEWGFGLAWESYHLLDCDERVCSGCFLVPGQDWMNSDHFRSDQSVRVDANKLPAAAVVVAVEGDVAAVDVAAADVVSLSSLVAEHFVALASVDPVVGPCSDRYWRWQYASKTSCPCHPEFHSAFAHAGEFQN